MKLECDRETAVAADRDMRIDLSVAKSLKNAVRLVGFDNAAA